MYTRYLGSCFRRDSNSQGYSPADFKSAVYSNSTTGAYQASSFVRTRLLRGLPNADYIQHRCSAPACRHRLRTPHFFLKRKKLIHHLPLHKASTCFWFLFRSLSYAELVISRFVVAPPCFAMRSTWYCAALTRSRASNFENPTSNAF